MANPASTHRDELVLLNKMKGLRISPEKVPQQTSKEAKVFQCEVCNSGFSTQKQLTRHQKIHKKVHKCKDCSEEFALETELMEHKNVHLKCDFCGKQYKQKKYLTQHMKTHTKRMK